MGQRHIDSFTSKRASNFEWITDSRALSMQKMIPLSLHHRFQIMKVESTFIARLGPFACRTFSSSSLSLRSEEETQKNLFSSFTLRSAIKNVGSNQIDSSQLFLSLSVEADRSEAGKKIAAEEIEALKEPAKHE
jgi:hypothetical protein